MSPTDPLFTNVYEKLDQFSKSSLINLEVPIEYNSLANTIIINSFRRRGYEGILLSVSKDYISMRKELREKNVNVEDLYFIDIISHMYGVMEVHVQEMDYVDSPLNISRIKELILQILQKRRAVKNFLLVDSITTLLFYNSIEATIDFQTFLKSIVEQYGLMVIVLSIENQSVNPDFIQNVRNLSNATINFREFTNSN